ncbi:MAG TPA: DUF4342 domain-containing protein [Candidatus Saccharimonadales bacterium]|nr:DUF4342 domain-containing protein [Candidatus Saccharimonadales bacterium]
MSSQSRTVVEEVKVAADELVRKVRELLHEGNVRRIIVKKDGHIVMEVPLTVAAIGVIAAPVLAAIGALAAFVGKYTIVIEKSEH